MVNAQDSSTFHGFSPRPLRPPEQVLEVLGRHPDGEAREMNFEELFLDVFEEFKKTSGDVPESNEPHMVPGVLVWSLAVVLEQLQQDSKVKLRLDGKIGLYSVAHTDERRPIST